MTTQAFWPYFAAPLFNALALALALGFRRNRALLVLAVLTLCALACADAVALSSETEARALEAVRMFAPWLLLFAAILREPGLLSRRSLIWLGLLLLAIWLTLAAPNHLWAALRAMLPLGVLPFSAGTVAAGITLIAAALCLLRFVLRGAPIEFGLSSVLVVAALAWPPQVRGEAALGALAVAGAGAVFAVLYASYRMAFVDALSGLPNRRALDETLARMSGSYALAMVDVDHFKRFNDTHGHDAGDRVLMAIARNLRRTPGGSAFRYGGEEFCLIFTGKHIHTAFESCETARAWIESSRVRVRSTLAPRRNGPVAPRTEASDVKVTVSIGLAERSTQVRLAAEVLKAADKALYRAKSKGRNRVMR